MRLASTQLIALFLGLIFASNAEAQQQKKPKPPARQTHSTKPSHITIEYVTGDKSRALPFSEAVRVGQMLYLAGQIGSDSSGAIVPGGIKAETKQAMEKIRAILERNGSSMDHVVKCTVMLADINERPAMSEVYVPTSLKIDFPRGAHSVRLV